MLLGDQLTTVDMTSPTVADGKRQPAIQAVNLTKTFGNRTAVDHLSFSVFPGELYALLGDNGAGKTTTISMLTTLLDPTGGQFFISGFDGVREAEKTKGAFGVVSQDVAIYGELTAYENLLFVADLYGIAGSVARRRIEMWLARAGLSDRAHDLASSFSTGMQRKLSIAAAMIHEPKVIFMDEPTVGLDPASRRQIWESLRELKSQGVTVLLTTHYLEEAELLADRIGIIRQGRLVIEGRIDELRERIKAICTITVSLGEKMALPVLREKIALIESMCPVRVDFDGLRNTLSFAPQGSDVLSETITMVLKWLEAEKIAFSRFATAEPSLEEVFLAVQAGRANLDSEAP